ncbi:amidohydrolase [Streptomyces lydicus]|uniref:amidohydrolase n=1 Tax=Streptomyces lydicus TaxID=47763 RepID=UPI0036E0BE19
MTYADLVFVNGRVMTMDSTSPMATAVAVRESLITYVGTDATTLIGPSTEVVDLRGRILLPGINDSHLHGCAYGLGKPPFSVDVALGSIAAVRAAVAEEVRRKQPGEWISGNGWNCDHFAECAGDARRRPTADDLDEVAPDNPVLLQDFSGHATWANSRAMEIAGVGGRGILHDGDQALVQRAAPPVTADVRRQVLREVVAEVNREGITSFTEPGLGPGGDSSFGGAMGTSVLSSYADLARAGDLTARVSVLGLASSLSGASAADTRTYLSSLPDLHGVAPRLVRLAGVKVFADGIPPSETAWMRQKYPSGGYGSLCTHGHTEELREEELTEILRLVHTAGLQAGVHVTGSRGIDAVVDSLATVAREHPHPKARHYVIHGQFASPSALATLATLGYGINFQPGIQHLTSDLVREMFGDEVADTEWPARSAIDTGVMTACSSDAPVTAPNWRAGVRSLVSRVAQGSGRVSGAAERITMEEALRTYTVNGAWQDHADDWKGSVTVGKVADLCLSGASAAQDLTSAPVEMTVFNGKVVHSTV